MFIRCLLIGVVLSSCFFLSEGSSVKQRIIVSDQSKVILINDNLSIYRTLDTLSADQAWAQISNGSMEAHRNPMKAAPEFRNYGYWIVFSVENETLHKEEFFLELAFNRVDTARLFEVRGDTSIVPLYTFGDVFDFHQRVINHRNFIFPLRLAAHQPKLFLLQIEKRGTVDRFPLKLYARSDLPSVVSLEAIIYGVSFGFFAIIVSMAFATAVFFKKRLFFYYGLYALSIALYMFTSLGFTFQYLTPNRPDWNLYNLVFLACIAMIGLALFTQILFATRLNFVRLHRALQVVAGYFLLYLLLIFSGWLMLFPDVFTIGLYVAILTLFVLVSTIAFYSIKKDSKAYWFLMGIGFSFGGILLSVLIDIGFVTIPVLVDASLAILFGFIGEFSCISIALLSAIVRLYQLSGTPVPADNPHQELTKVIEGQAILAGEIAYIESFGHYLKYHTDDGKVLLERKTMQAALTELEGASFCQTHRSYIINLMHVKQINSRKVVLRSGADVPVTRNYIGSLRRAYSDLNT